MMETVTPTAYMELERRFARVSLVRDSSAMLSWDWATMMPEGAAKARAKQLAELEMISHERLVDPKIQDLLEHAEQDMKVRSDPWHAANLGQMRQQWRHANALDSSLVESLAKATSECEMVWRTARESRDIREIVPQITSVVTLVREKAQSMSQVFGLDPYECLLDQYEQGLRVADIDLLFSDLLDFLPGLLTEIVEKQNKLPALAPLTGPFPVSKQQSLNRKFMEVLGFPFDHGRLDTSHHPFSGGTPEDLRITTRYDECNFMSSLMAVLHETGHALYEKGLPTKWRNQPVGGSLGMAIHESQSLLIEMQVCRSREFMKFAVPHIVDVFGDSVGTLDDSDWVRMLCNVEPGFIRVEADEVTYPFHIILRYRLEKLLINGELKVEDLPSAWREGMQELLGIDPPDDGAGCLQDIHWYGGDFGYFPTYTLGALTGAQMFSAATEQNTDILPSIGLGDFKPLYDWLGPKVHSLGCSLPAFSLIEQATRAPLSTKAFKRHLRERYL